MIDRVRPLLPALFAAACAAIILATLLIPQDAGDGFGPDLGPVPRAAFPLVIAVSYAFVAGLILRRHPRHAVGWLLAWFAVSFSVGVVFDDYAYTAGLPGREGVAALSGIGWILGVLPLVALTPLIFPTGRAASPRWRWLARSTLFGVLIVFVGNLLDPTLNSDLGLDNPLGIAAMEAWVDPVVAFGMVLVVAGAVGGLASLVQRYRRSVGVERQQLEWFGYGATITVLSAAGLGVLYETGRLEVGLVVFVFGSLALPVSIGLAILRYRLYDIDRVVSRTVSYTVLTLVLAGIYAVGVLGVGRVVLELTGGGGELVVAASTLAVAAVFRPVRSWAQTAVDRRFNRARYDARRTLEAFGQRLRDEVDLDALCADLIGAASTTMRPARVSLWLGAREHRP